MDEITVNGVTYVPKNTAAGNNGMPLVLVRSINAGVHFGELSKEEFTPAGKVVVLLNTRRVWKWAGAASLSQMAISGVSDPGNCKFSVEISQNEIVGVIETIPLSQVAATNLYGVSEWKA